MITFTREIPGTYVSASDAWVGRSTSTITGSAIQKRSDAQKIKDLGLVFETTVTLFFTPTLYDLMAYTDEFVKPDDTVIWNATKYTVKFVDPNPAPDGFVIGATIILTR